MGQTVSPGTGPSEKKSPQNESVSQSPPSLPRHSATRHTWIFFKEVDELQTSCGTGPGVYNAILGIDTY